MENKANGLSCSAPLKRYLFQPLENCIRNKLIPAITGRLSVSDLERDLLSLPARMGGMDIRYPTDSVYSYSASVKITSSLSDHIVRQDSNSPLMAEDTARCKTEVKQQRSLNNEKKLEEIRQHLSANQLRLLDCALEKGASSWLTAIPLEENGFMLHKGDFRDAISLRYGWKVPNLPEKCGCVQSMSVDHAFICHKGGYPSICHNEIRDLTAALLSEVCPNTSTEPSRQPLGDENFDHDTAIRDDEARLDVKARGFWRKGQDAFFDVRVFHPNASSYRNKPLSSLYRQHENEKKRSYSQRVREVERAAFTPLVLTTTGGMARECTTFFKRLSAMLADKRRVPYHHVIAWLRCRVSFALLRQGIMALRGSRSSRILLKIPDDIPYAAPLF